jgi:hypothetical protein
LSAGTIVEGQDKRVRVSAAGAQARDGKALEGERRCVLKSRKGDGRGTER